MNEESTEKFSRLFLSHLTEKCLPKQEYKTKIQLKVLIVVQLFL